MKMLKKGLTAAVLTLAAALPGMAADAPASLPKVFSYGDNAKHLTVGNMHQTRYIELFLADRDPESGKIVAACFNTMFSSHGIPGSKDTAPQKEVAGLDFKKIAKQYGVIDVSLNGPKLWLPDWTQIDQGKQVDFNGLHTAWVAQLEMGENAKGVRATKPYTSQYIARKSALGWDKGTTVMLLDDPDGNTWVMKGFQLGLHPKYSYDEFMSKGAAMFKKLPEGWKVRVIKLEKELIEKPVKGVATIMADEHFNVYDLTGPGMMNYKP